MIHPAQTTRRAAGFSLVELMVVVGIIAALVALTFGGFAMFRSQAQVRQAMTLLQSAHLVAAEYQTVTGDTYNPLSDPGCPHGVDALDRHVECFVNAAWGLPETREHVLNLRDYLRVRDSEGLHHIEGGVEAALNDDGLDITIVDRWGRPLRYLARNVEGDDIGTNDPRRRMPRHHRPYFASAGPDQQWGDHRELVKQLNGESHDVQAADRSADNLYSFELD